MDFRGIGGCCVVLRVVGLWRVLGVVTVRVSTDPMFGEVLWMVFLAD